MNAQDAAGQFDIGTVVRVEPYGAGRINRTHLIKTNTKECFILQRMHGIFAPSVLSDIDAVTAHLSHRGFATPHLIKTVLGAHELIDKEVWWRMLSFIPGTTLEDGLSHRQTRSAGALLGLWHAALADIDHTFVHRLEGFHDTPAIMDNLKRVVLARSGSEKHAMLAPRAARVAERYAEIRTDFSSLPQRIIHGDPKVNNIRFDESGERAVALIDLDTLGRNSVVIDLGDAARSWCNAAEEHDRTRSRFDCVLFEAMISGYTETAKFLTDKECTAIPEAVGTIILELAARFLTDAFEETYFALDTKRYRSRYEQNLDCADAQIALYEDFEKKRSAINNIVLCR